MDAMDYVFAAFLGERHKRLKREGGELREEPPSKFQKIRHFGNVMIEEGGEATLLGELRHFGDDRLHTHVLST